MFPVRAAFSSAYKTVKIRNRPARRATVPGKSYIFLFPVLLFDPVVDLEFDPPLEGLVLLLADEDGFVLLLDDGFIEFDIGEGDDIGVIELMGLDDGDEFTTIPVFEFRPDAGPRVLTDTLTLSVPPQLMAARLAVIIIAIPRIFFISFSSKVVSFFIK